MTGREWLCADVRQSLLSADYVEKFGFPKALEFFWMKKPLFHAAT
jgi:hypothetical protein